jgi:probable 2-oxoglutarate dehydrogenase E1 component DHKTD1
MCDQRFDVLNTTPETPVNMHVVYPTTPAQFFHVMRRQMVQDYRRPLIVVGPKTLLRDPRCVSEIEEMGPGTKFQPVLGDTTVSGKEEGVSRVIFMAGKLYYDLVKKRQELGLEDKVAIVRMEELCPFPVSLKDEIARFPNASEFFWVQEEPQNQGAYTYIAPRIDHLLPEGNQVRPAPPFNCLVDIHWTRAFGSSGRWSSGNAQGRAGGSN